MKDSKAREAILELEKIVRELEKKVYAVGMVYSITLNYYARHQWRSWTKFATYDIQDQVGGKIKILGEWFDKSDVIYFEDAYKAKMKRVESKHKDAL